MATGTRETTFGRPTAPWARVPELLREVQDERRLQPA
jgi:hypothetical protein